MSSNPTIHDRVEAEIGVQKAALLKANACSRVCGLLMARGRIDEWERAYQHIAEHFYVDATKPSHSVFARRYRLRDAIKALVFRAASAPSSVHLTKLTIDGRPTGRAGVEIVRRFGEPIDETSKMTSLVIIADAQGALITAYPSAD
jgi:hypothetical protein